MIVYMCANFGVYSTFPPKVIVRGATQKEPLKSHPKLG